MSNVNLHIDQLVIHQKEQVLLNDFSVELSAPALVILTGANGAGKSTLLRTLAGLRAIDKGQINFNGSNLTALNNEMKALLMAFANSKKIEEDYIRIIDLIRLGRYPYLKVHHDVQLADDMIQWYINEMGIEAIQHKFLNEISDGELQKASIARALVQDTPFLLMDEPSAFLDYPSKKHLFELLKATAMQKNKIIICATHDVELAAKSGTHFWHFENTTIKISDHSITWHMND